MSWCSDAQRMRRFPCLQDCLLTLTWHLAAAWIFIFFNISTKKNILVKSFDRKVNAKTLYPGFARYCLQISTKPNLSRQVQFGVAVGKIQRHIWENTRKLEQYIHHHLQRQRRRRRCPHHSHTPSPPSPNAGPQHSQGTNVQNHRPQIPNWWRHHTHPDRSPPPPHLSTAPPRPEGMDHHQQKPSLSKKKTKKYATNEMTGKVKKQTDSSTQSSPTWPNSSTEREFRFKFSLTRFRIYPWFSLAKTKGKVLSFPWLKPRVKPHQNTTSCHTTRQRVDEPSKNPHSVKWHRKWGKKNPPPRVKDPPRIKDYQEKNLRLGSTFFLNQLRPNTSEHCIIHIEVESKTWIKRVIFCIGRRVIFCTFQTQCVW